MWKYIRRYLPIAFAAVLFMTAEVFVDLYQPKIMSSIVDDGVLGLGNGGHGDMHLILMLGLQMTILVLGGCVCGSLNSVCTNLSSQNVGNSIRKDCFKKIMGLSFEQTDRFTTGSLVTRITNDVSQTERMVAQFIRGMIRTGMLTLGGLYFMLTINPRYGMVVLCVLPFIVTVMIICLKKATPLFGKLQSQLDNVNHIMQEDITGIRIIKACVRESYEKIRFGRANEELIGTQLRVLIILSYMQPLMSILMNVAVVAVIYFGSFEVSAGTSSPGNIMAAITYTTQLLGGILMLVMLFQSITRGMASWKRIKEVLDTEPSLKDGNIDDISLAEGKVEFRNVSFAYPGSDKAVLRNINLTISPGESFAILGSTGCGKSTLVNLLPRFYDVTEGEVLIDNINVKDYTQEAIREKVAIALQKSELFCRTIYENIRWGEPLASEEEIRNAAEIAQASEFIEQTPNGYQTEVSAQGMSLSGGQRQRIAIARAVLKYANILIFDDATSALDLKTEADLYKALGKSRPQVTKIIVAQRIASVRNADRIAVMDHGTIVGLGNHRELLESCPIYREIYDSQLGNGGQE
ncbi:MAG: ABC transporter ATP-binding protein [Bacteroidales bacterium]|nr:ABC transporter ATP-binding protein [Bacteroidales bacterium]